MSNKNNHIFKLIKVLDKFSISLLALIQKLVKQRVVSLEAILKALPEKVREQFLKDLAPKEKGKVKVKAKSR